MRVQLPPRSTASALVVKRTSWLPPKEQVQVRLLAGVLFAASMVKRTSRGPAKAEFLVRFQVGALWPNPMRPQGPERLPARPSGGDWGFEPRSSWLDTSTG